MPWRWTRTRRSWQLRALAALVRDGAAAALEEEASAVAASAAAGAERSKEPQPGARNLRRSINQRMKAKPFEAWVWWRARRNENPQAPLVIVCGRIRQRASASRMSVAV